MHLLNDIHCLHPTLQDVHIENPYLSVNLYPRLHETTQIVFCITLPYKQDRQ